MNSNTSPEINEIQVIDGGLAVDDRGTLAFANSFEFTGVKRFYQVDNFSTKTIRAFHGHMKEAKYVYVVKGSIILALVHLNNPQTPSKDTPVTRMVLSSKRPQVIYIPPQYANGFKALEANTSIIFFSTSTLEESKGDDYRFPVDYWGTSIWEIENR